MWKAAFCAAFQARRAGTRMRLRVLLPGPPSAISTANCPISSMFRGFGPSHGCWEPKCTRLRNPRRMSTFTDSCSEPLLECGERGRNRTFNLLIKSQPALRRVGTCWRAVRAPDRKARSAWLVSAMMSFGGAGLTSPIVLRFGRYGLRYGSSFCAEIIKDLCAAHAFQVVVSTFRVCCERAMS